MAFSSKPKSGQQRAKGKEPLEAKRPSRSLEGGEGSSKGRLDKLPATVIAKSDRHAPKGKDEGWQAVSHWYDRCVGSQGHFYHRELILPHLEHALGLSRCSSLLDLGCGQGVIERLLSSSCRYLGVDASPTLLASAKQQRRHSDHQFLQADLSHPQHFAATFQLALFLLCLQNIPCGKTAIATAASHLEPSGKLAIVLNHPCFRIPRHSDWSEDPDRKTLTRRLYSYLSPLEIPIQAHPGKGSAEQSITYHHSLTDLFGWIAAAGLKVEQLDEWCCPKSSTGAKARMENRARLEFPLFLLLVASR